MLRFCTCSTWVVLSHPSTSGTKYFRDTQCNVCAFYSIHPLDKTVTQTGMCTTDDRHRWTWSAIPPVEHYPLNMQCSRVLPPGQISPIPMQTSLVRQKVYIKKIGGISWLPRTFEYQAVPIQVAYCVLKVCESGWGMMGVVFILSTLGGGFVLRKVIGSWDFSIAQSRVMAISWRSVVH